MSNNLAKVGVRAFEPGEKIAVVLPVFGGLYYSLLNLDEGTRCQR